jgi:PTS system N-acetylglucosamine-specific IIC component
MMFGLPAACLAMYRSAPPERRKSVGGMLLSMALTSLLTGVTEPIEFSFMFLAPMLYALHALLTGLSMVVMNALGVKLGFGFSAGLIDYVLNFRLSTRPWLLLLVVGPAYFAIYYFSFLFCIRRFGLHTPGREPVAAAGDAPAADTSRAGAFIAALGGAANLKRVEACTTRLRLVVADPAALDEPRLRALGARGVVRVGEDQVQVVLGPIADAVADEIRAWLHSAEGDGRDLASRLLGALGEGNVRAVEGRSKRLIVDVEDMKRIDFIALDKAGARAAARAGPATLHILVGEDSAPLARLLEPR